MATIHNSIVVVDYRLKITVICREANAHLQLNIYAMSESTNIKTTQVRKLKHVPLLWKTLFVLDAI